MPVLWDSSRMTFVYKRLRKVVLYIEGLSEVFLLSVERASPSLSVKAENTIKRYFTYRRPEQNRKRPKKKRGRSEKNRKGPEKNRRRSEKNRRIPENSIFALMTCGRSYMYWYPLKDLRDVLSLYRRLSEGIPCVKKSLSLSAISKGSFIDRRSLRSLCEDLLHYERFFDEHLRKS